MFRVWFVLLVVGFVFVDCSPRPAPSCTAGDVQACTCPSGSGTRTCSSDGTLGECLCSDAGATGGQGGGGGGGGSGGGDFQGYAGGYQCAGSGCGACTALAFDHACVRSENASDPLGIAQFVDVSGTAVVARGASDGGCMSRYFDALGGRDAYSAGVVSLKVYGSDGGEWEFEWAGHPADAGLGIASGDVLAVDFRSGFGPSLPQPDPVSPGAIPYVRMSLAIRRDAKLMVLRGSASSTPAPLPVTTGPRVCYHSDGCEIVVDYDLRVLGDAGTTLLHKGEHAEIDDWLVSFGGSPTRIQSTCADSQTPRTSYGYTRLR